VGDGRVEADRDVDLGELAAEPLGVGVEVLPAGQLAADREDFGFHAGVPLIRRWSGGMPRGTMKTSYYLAAAAVLAAAGVAVYARLPVPAAPPAVPVVPLT